VRSEDVAGPKDAGREEAVGDKLQAGEGETQVRPLGHALAGRPRAEDDDARRDDERESEDGGLEESIRPCEDRA